MSRAVPGTRDLLLDVRLPMALVLFGALLSGCGGATDATSSERSSQTSSPVVTGCPRDLKLGGEVGQDVAISWSPVADKLAVSSAGTISVLDTDTCEISKVSDGNEADWSPDGRKVVFSRYDGLFVANEDGTDVEQITVTSTDEAGAGDEDRSPHWSPRGDLIAFVHSETNRYEDRNLSLGVVRPNGSGRRLVLEKGSFSDLGGPIPVVAPKWSPDGHRIMWMDWDGLSWITDRGERRSGVEIVPPVPPLAVIDYSLSPDGKLLALAIARNEKAKPDLEESFRTRPRIWLVPGEGGRRQPLPLAPALPHSDFSPSWSGDRRWIGFVRHDVDRRGLSRTEIYAVRPDGSDLHRLTRSQ